MCPFSIEATTPVELKKESERELAISWKDGHRSVYRFHDLRESCMCAACTDERTGEKKIDPDTIEEHIHPLSVNPVGRYAVQFHWSDGHTTGIYSFDYLRSLCPCRSCQG